MREGEPSRTALGAAVYRAVHQDLDGAAIFRDPLAWQILGLDRAALLADPEVTARARLRIFIAARHRFAEDSLAVAVERGTRQVVVLGAGLDTFAYRNRYAGTRVFEVDFPATGHRPPATGRWKRERLAEARIAVPDNLTYVGVDFESDDLGSRLVEARLLADLGFGEVEDLDRSEIRERFLGRPGGTATGGAHLLRARA